VHGEIECKYSESGHPHLSLKEGAIGWTKVQCCLIKSAMQERHIMDLFDRGAAHLPPENRLNKSPMQRCWNRT
jgi:hypothetical protein